jgi:environmental stress-induced protein Ves
MPPACGVAGARASRGDAVVGAAAGSIYNRTLRAMSAPCRPRSAGVEPMVQHCLMRPADYRRMPWRNGAGRTTEIAAFPSRAAPDAFDWRISVADVVKDCPFSHFAGVDRTIVVIAGAGMRLDDDGHAVSLTCASEPYAFSGDAAVGCTLLDGPVRDFNLMLRRDRARGRVTVMRGEGARVAPARFRLCYTVTGAYECLLAGHVPLTVAADHALLVEDDGGAAVPLPLNPLTRDAVAIVTAIDLAP